MPAAVRAKSVALIVPLRLGQVRLSLSRHQPSTFSCLPRRQIHRQCRMACPPAKCPLTGLAVALLWRPASLSSCTVLPRLADARVGDPPSPSLSTPPYLGRFLLLPPTFFSPSPSSHASYVAVKPIRSFPSPRTAVTPRGTLPSDPTHIEASVLLIARPLES